MAKSEVHFEVELTDAQAWYLAQFLKQVGFLEFNVERQMRKPTRCKRQRALAEAGFDLRCHKGLFNFVY